MRRVVQLDVRQERPIRLLVDLITIVRILPQISVRSGDKDVVVVLADLLNLA